MTDEVVSSLNLGSREIARVFSESVGRVDNDTLGIYDICNTRSEWEALAGQGKRTLWVTKSAECSLRGKWICEATIRNEQETKTVEFMEDIIAYIPVSYPTEDFSRRIHKVIDLKSYEAGIQMVTVESEIWVDGKSTQLFTEVLFANGKPQYQ